MGGWLDQNENITISTQVKVVVEVGVELGKNQLFSIATIFLPVL